MGSVFHDAVPMIQQASNSHCLPVNLFPRALQEDNSSLSIENWLHEFTSLPLVNSMETEYIQCGGFSSVSSGGLNLHSIPVELDTSSMVNQILKMHLVFRIPSRAPDKRGYQG